MKDRCPCKRYQCERHGNCIACKEFHKQSSKYKQTTCERLEDNRLPHKIKKNEKP